MAIDMTTVKQIMHNDKEVVKIEDGLGKVLWQKKAEPQWHTIWSGSAWAKRETSGDKNIYSRSTDSTFYTLPTEYTKFRFTFNYSWGNNVVSSDRIYYSNGSTVSSLTSPLVIDGVNVPTSSTNKLLGIRYEHLYYGSYHIWWLLINIDSKRGLKINSDGATYLAGESGTSQFTLTQIEAYY